MRRLPGGAGGCPAEGGMMATPEKPVLSVVVAIVSDTTDRPDVAHLDPCLAALTRQSVQPPMEIIVPYHPSVDGIAGMRLKYPDVRFLEAAKLATYSGQGGSSLGQVGVDANYNWHS